MNLKNLSVKIKIPKIFRDTLKNKKISTIYNRFEKTLNIDEKFAVAVSGGPDSLALCFLISYYKSIENKKIQTYFFIVDHGLRKGSAEEALYVKKQLKTKKINLKILKWRGKKPNSNLQSLAREKRYNLLFNECDKLNIKNILTAHNEDDVYETFFSRLLRGSGLEGLSSFVKVEKKFIFKGNTISVIRPLLDCTKESLTYITKKVFNSYINDPSNYMEKFQRVRLRNIITNLKNQGLNFDKLKLTINNLASANTTINEMVINNISSNVNYIKKRYLIAPAFFSYPDEIVFRSFSILIKKISKKDYPPRGRKIISLIKELNSKDKIKATLGGTIIEKIHNSVVVYEEKTKKG